MARISFSERRRRFRSILERPRVTNLASVFDTASARLADAAGYEIGFMAGSVASAVILGGPDLVLLTLTEFTDQARRICRAADLPLLVDADHGYGNALNVMRTVQELEMAGVAGLTIEDTELPRTYGSANVDLISQEEFADKLRAAIEARVDPTLVIIGRTGSLTRAGMEEMLARVRLCSEIGVDGLFVLGARTVEQFREIHQTSHLPIMSNALPLEAEELAANGVRLINQGHQPYYAMLHSLFSSYRHLAAGGSPAELESGEQSLVQAIAMREEDYTSWTNSFLRPG